MARFEVYRNPGVHAASIPYLLDVQADLLDQLDSRVVIPLRRLDQFGTVTLPQTLAPVFSIEGHDCILETPKLASVPRRILAKPVASLANEQSSVTAAMDFLFHGF